VALKPLFRYTAVIVAALFMLALGWLLLNGHWAFMRMR
jgi:hypothetical protein